MSSSFDDRKNSFESRFAHDNELQFKVEARRNRLLGEWAADILGHEGEARAAYAREVVQADFEEAGDDDVFRKLAADLGEKVPAAEIRAKMEATKATARDQVMSETR